MSLKERITSTPEGLKAWHQERVIFETTNMLCKIMDEESVSRTELSRRLGTSKGYITQLLDGSANMTLRTVTDAFLALGHEFHPLSSRITENGQGNGVSVRQIIMATPFG